MYFGRIINSIDCCRYCKEKKQKQTSVSKDNHNPDGIYDQVEDTTGYSELSGISKPTFYEKMAK